MRNFGMNVSCEKWGKHIIRSQTGCNGWCVSPMDSLLSSMEHNLAFCALKSEKNLLLF